jgi:hypothetical protein
MMGGYVIGTSDILPMAFAILEFLSFPAMSCHWGWTLKSGERKNEHNFSPSVRLEATSPLSAFHLSHQLFLVLWLLFSCPRMSCQWGSRLKTALPRSYHPPACLPLHRSVVACVVAFVLTTGSPLHSRFVVGVDGEVVFNVGRGSSHINCVHSLSDLSRATEREKEGCSCPDPLSFFMLWCVTQTQASAASHSLQYRIGPRGTLLF